MAMIKPYYMADVKSIGNFVFVCCNISYGQTLLSSMAANRKGRYVKARFHEAGTGCMNIVPKKLTVQHGPKQFQVGK